MTEIYLQFRIAHYRLSGNAPVSSTKSLGSVAFVLNVRVHVDRQQHQRDTWVAQLQQHKDERQQRHATMTQQLQRAQEEAMAQYEVLERGLLMDPTDYLHQTSERLIGVWCLYIMFAVRRLRSSTRTPKQNIVGKQ